MFVGLGVRSSGRLSKYWLSFLLERKVTTGPGACGLGTARLQLCVSAECREGTEGAQAFPSLFFSYTSRKERRRGSRAALRPWNYNLPPTDHAGRRPRFGAELICPGGHSFVSKYTSASTA